MAFLQAKSRPLLGIDISSTAVKLLELGKRGSRHEVLSYAAMPLPEDAVTDRQVNNVEAVANTIQAAVRKARTKTKEAVVAVAGSSAITKVITMPGGLREEELEQQVALEAEQHIPFAMDEVNFDFEVLGVSENDAEQIDVLLAASRTEFVQARVDALELAGLKAGVVDIESYALENSCELLRHQMPEEGGDKLVALFDIGASNTAFTVLNDCKSLYTRDQGFGGRQLTDDIMERYELSYEEAGRAKKQGGLPSGYEEEVLAPFLHDLAQMVNRSLQLFFSANGRYAHVDQIILGGGCAALEGIAEIVQEQLGVPTVVANPFADMVINRQANPKALERDTPALLIASGLALRGL